MDRRLNAIIWLLFFAMGFSTTNLLFRTAWFWKLSPLSVLSVALLAGSVAMFPFTIRERRQQGHSINLSTENLLYLVILVLTATVVPFWLQLEGFRRTTATKGGIILSLIPLLTTIFSRLILKRSPDFPLIVRLLLMTFGGFLLSWEGRVGDVNPGDWMIFGAVVCFSISMVIAHRLLQRWPLEIIVQCRLSFGFLILFPIAWYTTTPSAWLNPRLLLLGSAVGALMVLFITGIYRGMKTLGPEYASLFDILAALLTGIGSYLLWGELMQSIQWIGAGIILALSLELFLSPPEERPDDGANGRREEKETRDHEKT